MGSKQDHNFLYCYHCESENPSNNGILFTENVDDFLEFLVNASEDMAMQGYFSGSGMLNGVRYFFRDPNGFSKLYLGLNNHDQWISSRSWLDLVGKGIDIKDIFALPKGQLISLVNNKFIVNKLLRVPCIYIPISDIKHELYKRLDLLFKTIKNYVACKNEIFSKDCIALALSGGLDSSTLLAVGSKHLEITAHTLELPDSVDASLAKEIAYQCSSKFYKHPVSQKDVINSLNRSPILCEDWRDFNVHCATLNHLLADKIKKSNAHIKIIITGDLMNEYVCDYQDEPYKGKLYYQLPKISLKSLQKWLVAGLSTSSREDRVFDSLGFFLIQPYAIAYDIYSLLSESDLSVPNLKRKCNLIDDEAWLSELISTEKIRSQIGNKKNMGILGMAIDASLDNKEFAKFIAQASGLNVEDITQLIFGGKFRTLSIN